MNDTIRAILDILDDGRTPELRIAAAQVVGELGSKDQAIVSRLTRALEGAEGYLSRHVLGALARIGSAAAVRALVAELDRTQHADVAAHLLAEVGEAAAAPLASAFDEAGPEARARIVSILGRIPTSGSLEVLEKSLLDPELSKRASDAIVGHQLERLDKRGVQSLKSRLVKALKAEGLAAQAVATILGLITRLDASGSRPTLLKHAGPAYPGMVRKAALESLVSVSITPAQARDLLAYVDEPDDVHVVDPVIRVLSSVTEWADDAVPKLCELLKHRDTRLCLFAARAMRHAPHKDAVKPLLEYLDGSDPELRAAATAALGANPAARDALMRAMSTERNVDRYGRLAAAAGPHFASLGDQALRAQVEKACKLLISQDSRGEILLDALASSQPDVVPGLVVDKAVRFRRQRKLVESIALLAFLGQADRLDPEGRYQLGLSRLLLDSGQRKGDEVDEPGDATMGYLAMLVREGFPMLERLTKESMLKPEDLLRVGQHFAEGVGEERRFAAEVLHHVADKHGRQRAGEEARLALRADGF